MEKKCSPLLQWNTEKTQYNSRAVQTNRQTSTHTSLSHPLYSPVKIEAFGAKTSGRPSLPLFSLNASSLSPATDLPRRREERGRTRFVHLPILTRRFVANVWKQEASSGSPFPPTNHCYFGQFFMRKKLRFLRFFAAYIWDRRPLVLLEAHFGQKPFRKEPQAFLSYNFAYVAAEIQICNY